MFDKLYIQCIKLCLFGVLIIRSNIVKHSCIVVLFEISAWWSVLFFNLLYLYTYPCGYHWFFVQATFILRKLSNKQQDYIGKDRVCALCLKQLSTQRRAPRVYVIFQLCVTAFRTRIYACKPVLYEPSPPYLIILTTQYYMKPAVTVLCVTVVIRYGVSLLAEFCITR